jgi:hypothetical protein
MAQIIEFQEEGKMSVLSSEEAALIGWVTERITDGEDYRNINFKDKWDEYYRLWRGIHTEADKTRASERSKLISPALQQAIEAAVAELEEATFGRGRWFDVSDDISDQEKQDMAIFRNLLMEDLDQAGVREAISEVFLNGALYGTGVGKIVVEKGLERAVGAYSEFDVDEIEKITVKLVAVPPEEFVIDPAARSIQEAMYCGQVMTVPRHTILAKQEQGIYNQGDFGEYPDGDDVFAKGESKSAKLSDKVKITEYHGLVPSSLLTPELNDGEEYAEIDTGLPKEDIPFGYDDTDLVEAIITIANDGFILKAVRNPYTMGDRCFVAYQHDTVPNRFWGRGVAEKGYNPQKALDAELRGRMDAMALAIHPMMAMDGTRIPRGGDLSVKPGRTILTNGDPRTVLMPFNFGTVGQNTFAQSGELERMVQMGTGSMDSATPVGISPRNSTASGMSMMLGGAIKRSKRTLANIERLFTSPLIHKAAWRYMQFDPERYPVRDVKFVVHSTLGIMAREMEQQQLTGLLQTVPAESPAYWMLIRSVYENSSISNRDQMIAIVDQMLQKILNPAPPQPDFDQQLKAQEIQQKGQMEQARIQVEFIRANAEVARLMLEKEKAITDSAKKEAETMLTLAKAEAEVLGAQLEQYKVMTDALQAESGEIYARNTGEGIRGTSGNVQQ